MCQYCLRLRIEFWKCVLPFHDGFLNIRCIQLFQNLWTTMWHLKKICEKLYNLFSRKKNIIFKNDPDSIFFKKLKSSKVMLAGVILKKLESRKMGSMNKNFKQEFSQFLCPNIYHFGIHNHSNDHCQEDYE